MTSVLSSSPCALMVSRMRPISLSACASAAQYTSDLHAAFPARAVVALNVNDERVVQFTLRFDGVEDAAHLVVGVRERRAIHFRSACRLPRSRRCRPECK